MWLWVLKILRIICACLDKLAYWALEMVYELFINIAEAGIFKQATIQQFATRIYAFLGLIMVFKVSISLVTYVMNPDNFNKADVGAPALLKGFIFALVGIVAVPYVFEMAYALQRIVLSNNIIGNLILGISAGTENSVNSNYIEDGGKLMASTTIRAFYRPDTGLLINNNQVIDDKCADNPQNCQSFLELLDGDVQDKVKKYYDKNPVVTSEILDADILNATYNKEFVMKYTPIISTACGLFIAYVLLLFCIDIAVRAVKLSFLQLIAPIPLIAKIDPKKGGKIFDNWFKECTTTYLDVFLRLATIYFALYIITAISSPYRMTTGKEYEGFVGILVRVFLIIGTLNFARELPKLLGSILGIDFKGMGGFTLSPYKKLRQTPLIGGAMAEGLRSVNRTMGSLGRTAVSGVPAAFGREKSRQKLKDSWKSTGRSWANMPGGMLAATKNSLGITENQLDRLELEKANLMKKNKETNAGISKKQAVADSIKKLEDRAWDQISTGQAKATYSYIGADGNRVDTNENLSDKYRALNAKLSSIKGMSDAEWNNPANGYSYDADGNGITQEEAIAAAQKELDDFKQEAINSYMSQVNFEDDKTFGNLYQDYEEQCRISGEAVADRSQINGSTSLHSTFGKLKGEISSMKRGMMSDNDRLSTIDNEQKRLQEEIKAGKPYRPDFGGKK